MSIRADRDRHLPAISMKSAGWPVNNGVTRSFGADGPEVAHRLAPTMTGGICQSSGAASSSKEESDQRFRWRYASPAPPSFTSMTRQVTRKRIATASGRATSVLRGICVIAEATGADWMLVGSTAAVATSFDTGAPNALWK